MTTKASASLVYYCEMDIAAHYALSHPALARECLHTALDAAIDMKRPDLAYRANDLLSAIGGES